MTSAVQKYRPKKYLILKSRQKVRKNLKAQKFDRVLQKWIYGKMNKKGEIKILTILTKQKINQETKKLYFLKFINYDTTSTVLHQTVFCQTEKAKKYIFHCLNLIKAFSHLR